MERRQSDGASLLFSWSTDAALRSELGLLNSAFQFAEAVSLLCCTPRKRIECLAAS